VSGNILAMRILLLAQSMWHGPARFPKALKAAGFEVAALCGSKEWIAFTEYVDRHFFVADWEPRNYLKQLIQTIEAWQPDLVLPCSDNMVRAAQDLRLAIEAGKASLSDRMVEVLLRSTFPSSSNRLLDSKFELLEALQERGVRIPPQRALLMMGDADAFVQEHGYPALLKPDHGHAGIGIHFCKDEETLLASLETVFRDRTGGRYAIQKYLGNKTALIEFVAKDGRVLASHCAQRVKTHPGETGPVTVLRTVECPEMERAAEVMCDLLGYNGIGVPQFSVTDDSCQEAYLLELNPRISHFPHIWGRVGTDFAKALFDGWSGKRVDRRPTVVDQTLTLWPQEALRDPQSPYLTADADYVTDDPKLEEAYQQSIIARTETLKRREASANSASS